MTELDNIFNGEEVGFIEMETTPESNNWDKLERYIAGVGGTTITAEKRGIAEQLLLQSTIRGEVSASSDDTISPSKFIDNRILTMMELAEALVISEGDLFQTIVTPMSVGLTEIQIRHKDSGVKKLYQELFESLEM